MSSTTDLTVESYSLYCKKLAKNDEAVADMFGLAGEPNLPVVGRDEAEPIVAQQIENIERTRRQQLEWAEAAKYDARKSFWHLWDEGWVADQCAEAIISEHFRRVRGYGTGL